MKTHNTGRVIYIGPQRVPTNDYEQFLSYGQTGMGIVDPCHAGLVDFRPDGRNITHLVAPATLHWIET